MKRILVFYYTKEVHNNSYSSVPRLLASLISYLEKNYQVVFFTFNPTFEDLQIKTKPVLLTFHTLKKIRRKINNALGFKRITYLQLKQSSTREYLNKSKLKFDYILTLRLDDLVFLRKKNDHVRIFYWIHDVSTAHSNKLESINNATDILSPSITTYKEIVRKIQPKALVSSFTFLPNWCAPYFRKFDDNVRHNIRLKYGIEKSSIVFAFAGGDVALKGGNLIKNVFENLDTTNNCQNIVLFFIGGKLKYNSLLRNGIKLIETGTIDPIDVAECYNISKFGLMPSLGYDHAPLTLIEMISCGVVPIASDIGGIKEMLGNSYTMLIHIPNSKDEWKYKIQTATKLLSSEFCNILRELEYKISQTYNINHSFSIFDKLLNE